MSERSPIDRSKRGLILTRLEDESIMIGNDVEVYVAEIIGNKVRLGIRAPKNIPVHRTEVYDRIQRDKSSPANSSQYQRDTNPITYNPDQPRGE